MLMLLACQDPTAPMLDPLSGDVPLIAYNGDRLPVNEFELSNRQGGGTGCWSVLTSGTLSLEPETGRFSGRDIRRLSYL